LVNQESGGQLMARVKGVRKKLSAELGFLVQPVRIRDALNLEPDAYHIVLNGVVRGRGEVKVGRELAINPGQVFGTLNGIAAAAAHDRINQRVTPRPARGEHSIRHARMHVHQTANFTLNLRIAFARASDKRGLIRRWQFHRVCRHVLHFGPSGGVQGLCLLRFCDA
jgi:hypothetical protein